MQLAIPGTSESLRFTDGPSLSVLVGPALVAEEAEAVLRNLGFRLGTGSLLLVIAESRRVGKRDPAGGFEADTDRHDGTSPVPLSAAGSGLFPALERSLSEGSSESIDWMVSVIS